MSPKPSEPEGGDREGEGGVAVEKRTKPKLEKPKLYKVIFHNDDYTTMEFVTMVLMTVFNKSESDALAIMLNVHQRGAGVAGLYTYDVAETKVEKTLSLAREYEYPLLVTMEPE